MTLRRTWHRKRAARAIVAALVIEAMHLVRFGKQSARLVLHDGIVLPGVPMAEHDFHEFVGAIVARIVTDHFVTAHILRFAVVERRDDVPGSTAAGHQIEGCEYPGD